MKPAAFPRTKVLVLHQRPGVGAAATFCPESEAGVLDQVNAVVEALERCGVPARGAAVANIAEVLDVLKTAPEDVVFNLVESLPPGQDANMVPSLCAAFGKGVTGADSACLALTQNKWRTNCLLQGIGVPVPASLLVMPGETVDPEKLPPPPYIVKPVATDASEGLAAIVSPKGDGAAKLVAAVAGIHRQFNQGALIETLVGQREINVSIFQDERGLRVMPLAEINFSAFPAATPRVVDYDAKWKSDSFAFHHTPRIIPAPLPDDLADRIRHISQTAYRACGCQCYARVDLRLDDAGGVHVLEINANPDLSPDAGFTAALAAGGVTFDAFVTTVIQRALDTVTPRESPVSSSDQPSRGPSRDRTSRHGEITIRPTIAADRDDILAFMAATGFFREDEMAIAEEVLDDSIMKGAAAGYYSLTALQDHQPVGWACFGPTACTLGTFDLYWIGVDPETQGKGVGRHLLAAVEKAIAQLGGRLVIIETAGRDDYEPTRQFYLRTGCVMHPEIPDFYAPGDGKVIFTKVLACNNSLIASSGG